MKMCTPQYNLCHKQNTQMLKGAYRYKIIPRSLECLIKVSKSGFPAC